MAQQAEDEPIYGTDEYFQAEAESAGLGEFTQEEEAEPIKAGFEQVEQEDAVEEDTYDYDEDYDPMDFKTNVSAISDDDIEEVQKYSPKDATRIVNLKAGQGALDSYLKHQQGIGGYNQIMSGNISAQVKSNMRNNLPGNLKKVPDEKLRDTFVGYWRNRLGTIKPGGTPEQRAAITKAAIDNGEDPDKWLRIAQIESSYNPNAVSPSGRHKGFFQIDSKYVNNPALLRDPYQSTVLAIRHNKNAFKNGKLDYQQWGGNTQLNDFNNKGGINMNPINSLGYTPVSNFPTSNPNSMFGGVAWQNNNMPYSDPNSQFKGAALNNDFQRSTGFSAQSLDPTGISQVIGQIDSVGAGAVNAISNTMKGIKQVKGIIGQGVDSAVTGISSILGEKQNQRNYLKILEKLYGEGSYGEGPLDVQLRQKAAYTQHGI